MALAKEKPRRNNLQGWVDESRRRQPNPTQVLSPLGWKPAVFLAALD